MNTKEEQDLTLLRPFDLEKAKQGDEVYLEGYGYGLYVLSSNKENEIVLNIDDYGYIVVGGSCIRQIYDVKMKPLCWLEGKPVYKGDEIWSKAKGLENYNYIVDRYEPISQTVYATSSSKGCVEQIDNLSWTKQVKQIKSTYVEELVHDKDKFKPGDIVKVVRKFDATEKPTSTWHNVWVSNMDCLVGTVQTVIESSVSGVYFEDSQYGFPSCTLKLVKEVEQVKTEETKGKKLEIYIDGNLVSTTII